MTSATKYPVRPEIARAAHAAGHLRYTTILKKNKKSATAASHFSFTTILFVCTQRYMFSISVSISFSISIPFSISFPISI